MKLNGRIVALERRVASRVVVPSRADPGRRAREVFLARVPGDLRAAVESLLDAPDPQRGERWPAGSGLLRAVRAPELGRRLLLPSVAGGMGARPAASVLDWPPLRPLRVGRALYLSWSNDPRPPPDPRPFPLCPSCGGVTSHAAYYQPDPVMEGMA